ARIREAIERSPQASTHRLSNELDVPRATVLKILRFTLKKKRAYHIQVLHKLDEEDYAARKAVCYDLMEAVNNENLFEHILFSDEATFLTCGKVNKHNCRIWDIEPTTHDTRMAKGHSESQCVAWVYQIHCVWSFHVR
ncbi:hypothetical protein C0J52_25095, partial [Blattella germanica]